MTATDAVVANTIPVEGVGATHQRFQPSVNLVAALAMAIGASAVGLTFGVADTHDRLFEVTWLHGLWLPLALLGLTCAAELVAVRMRHEDDAVEELTLLDGVVLINALVLPIREALIVTLGGILVVLAVRRLSPIKLGYNLGVYATASTVTALLVHAIAPPEGEFGLRLVLAIGVAAAAFVAVNLVHMAVLLMAISGQRPWDVIRQDASLSTLTTIGTVCLTATVLVMSVTAPVLLPCAVLPAAALWYAYGASAAKHEERRRSARVLEYSQVLASAPTRTVAVDALLRLVHEEFEAAASLVLFEDGTGLHLDSTKSPVGPVTMTAEHHVLSAVPALAILGATELPFGWQSAMVAPVVVDGQRIGTVVVTPSNARLRPRDLTTLSPLVGSLAVALQNADQMTQLVEETSKLRAVVEQASDGIVVLGRGGVIQVWSPAMAVLTGVGADTAVGARLSEVLMAEDMEDRAADPFVEGQRRLSSESSQASVDVQLLRPDGERRSTRFSHAGAFRDGVLVRDVVIVRDLTAEWQVQRMKSDFIATVSHELRTPLTPIKGYADMLRKRGETMPPEKRDRALSVIIDRAEHLGRLVEDLLAASTITADKEPTHSLATTEADLIALVARACEDFPAAKSRILVEARNEPVMVLCDPTRVVQIAGNLISNALKYSPDGSQVVVSVDALDGQGQIEVRDQGQGIPEDQLDRVFDKFHRVEDPMVMSTSGTGLGLFIARHLARAMGGDLTTASTLGVGSRFALRLPAGGAVTEGVQTPAITSTLKH